jgi:hypothetical protein
MYTSRNALYFPIVSYSHYLVKCYPVLQVPLLMNQPSSLYNSSLVINQNKSSPCIEQHHAGLTVKTPIRNRCEHDNIIEVNLLLQS